MSDSQIKVTEAGWLLIEKGRGVVIRGGKDNGKFAVIVTIIDQHRVLVDGPSSDPEQAVSRQALHINNISLSPILLEKLPRDAGTGALRKVWEAQEIDKKFSQSTHAKKRQQQLLRAGLNDFQRFKVMRLKKQTGFEVKKAAAKVKASA